MSMGVRSAPLLADLLLKRPDVTFYPLHSTLKGVDVLGKQLVAHTILVDNVVVHASAGGGSAEEETEESSGVVSIAAVGI
jgi:hypothetical protein